MTHPPSGVGNVAKVARYDVHVQMKHGLSRSGTGVDADVVTVGLVSFFDFKLGESDGLGEGLLLFWSGLEPGGHDPSGNEESVAR